MDGAFQNFTMDFHVAFCIPFLFCQFAEVQSQAITPKPVHKRVRDERVVIPVTYKKGEAPIPEDIDDLLLINIEMRIWTITEVSVEEMSLTVDLHLTFRWHDNRVTFTNYTMTNSNSTWIPVGEKTENLWKPMVTFLNCIGCDILPLDAKKNKMFYEENTKEFKVSVRYEFSRLDFKSNDEYSPNITTRKTIIHFPTGTLTTFSCEFDLSAYPMDHQLCKIMLVNAYEDATEVQFNLTFTESHASIFSNISLPEFNVEDIRGGGCIISLDGSYIPCVQLEIAMERLMGHHIMVLYAPSVLIVILSWVSFWLDVEATPARTALGLTSLLTLATQFAQAQKNLPPVAYVKAIDVWMFACIFLVFASLIEFALANYSYRKRKSGTVQPQALTTVIQVRPFMVKKEKPQPLPTSKEAKEQFTPRVDIIARITFPCGFLLFLIIYIATYLA